MKLSTLWNGKMRFSAGTEDFAIPLDAKAPIGEGSALTPKHMLLAAACGCTGMDLVALLKKHKQPLEGLEIEAEVATTEGVQPVVFTSMKLTFQLRGQVDPARALEAIRLSQTKYCGVSAMLTKAFPISYTVFLNGELLGSGEARFN